MGFLDKFRKKPDVSPGGSPIYRYEEPKDEGFRPPKAAGIYAKALTEHFEALFPGRESFVFHELISDLIHVDINVMKPVPDDPKKNFYVLYTTGMSDLPMTLPDELADKADLKYAELFLFLPGSWDLGKEYTLAKDMPSSRYWPIHMLKFLARFPHQYQTWLAYGHTMPNGPDYTPMDDSVGFGGVVLSQLNGDMGQMIAGDGAQINLLFAIPAYKEEIEYKLKYGMNALNERFSENKMPMVLDPNRPNYCADFHEVLD